MLMELHGVEDVLIRTIKLLEKIIEFTISPLIDKLD